MARPIDTEGKLKDLVSPKDRTANGGRIAPLVARRQRQRLPIDQHIVRNIKGDAGLTHEICEISLWSQEFSDAIGAITTDCFQQIGGQSASWRMSETRDGTENGPKTHPDVLAIGQEIATRMFNGRYVIGGDRLQAIALDYHQYGDGFLELGIAKDGAGDYCINRAVERPSLQMFPLCDGLGEIENYALKSGRSTFGMVADDDVIIPRWKVLHLSRFPDRTGLGRPASLPMVDKAWQPLKETAADLSDAIRSAGSSTLVHEMDESTTPEDRFAYEEEIIAKRASGPILDLFIANGSKVYELGKAGDRVDALFQAFTSYRAMMIPFGIPSWAFPAISGRQDSNKDIANQPAMLYSRQIADLRSKMGEKIKWAITLEIVLKKGYDFYTKEGGFDIVWPEWFVTGMESGLLGQIQGRGDSRQMARVESMLSDIQRQTQHSIDLINTGKVIHEISQRSDYDY